MLRFTKQVDYGLMAMQYIAAHQADGAIGVRRMSRCSRRQPARKIQAAITEMLDTMTLAELIGDDVPAPWRSGGGRS